MDFAAARREELVKRQEQGLEDGLMAVCRHRQDLEIAVVEFDQSRCLIGEPKIGVFRPGALRGQQVDDEVFPVLARRDCQGCSGWHFCSSQSESRHTNPNDRCGAEKRQLDLPFASLER